MADNRILADTSVFIEYLRSKQKESTQLLKMAATKNVETSAIVAAELYYGARTPSAEKRIREVLEDFTVHAFTNEMAARQCEIVRDLLQKNKMQDIRDIMIATTALELGLPLATLNPAHFEPILGLILVD